MLIHLSLSGKDVVLCRDNFSHRSSHVIFFLIFHPISCCLEWLRYLLIFFPAHVNRRVTGFLFGITIPFNIITRSSLKLSNLSVKLETKLLFLSSHKSFLYQEQLMLQVSVMTQPLIHRVRESSALSSQTLLHSSLLQTFSPSMCLAKAECNFPQLHELAARWCSLSSEKLRF